MPAKQVVDRQKSATAVIAAATTHAPRVAASIKGALSPVLAKNQETPDIQGLMFGVARWLGETTNAMIATDEAHTDELADDEEPRQRRDNAAAALQEELSSLRGLITGVYGAAARRAFGFAAETPREPTMLSRFGGEVARALREKKLPAASRQDTSVKWSPTAAATKLDALCATLDKALEDVANEVREAQGTLANKNAALDAYDDAFRRSSNLLVGLFTFAGETALAERVRPSSRRPGQTEELAPPAGAGASGEAAPEAEEDVIAEEAAPEEEPVGARKEPAPPKKKTKGR